MDNLKRKSRQYFGNQSTKYGKMTKQLKICLRVKALDLPCLLKLRVQVIKHRLIDVINNQVDT